MIKGKIFECEIFGETLYMFITKAKELNNNNIIKIKLKIIFDNFYFIFN